MRTWPRRRRSRRRLTSVLVPLAILALTTPARAGIDAYGLLTGINSSPGQAIAFSTLTNTTIGSVITIGGGPVNAVFSLDGRYAYTADAQPDSVTIVDVATQTVVGTIAVGSPPAGIAISPDGRYVYATTIVGNSVSVISTATNQVVGAFPVSSPFGVAVSPDGTTLYVTNSQQNTVSFLDATSGTVTASIAVGNSPVSVAVAPDGSKIYVASQNNGGRLTVVDTASRTVVATINGPAGNAAVSPDGTRVYVTDQGNTLYVIDATTNTILTTVALPGNSVGVSVKADGSRVYVSSSSRVIVVDTATNTIIANVSTPVGSNLNFGTGWIGPNVIVATGGAVSAGSDAALTALGFDQYVIFNGGTLQLTGTFSTAKTISLLALGGVIDTNGFDLTLTGTIINDGMLTKTGLGTLTLTGANTYTGGTLVTGGLINFSAANNFGTGLITLNGGGLQWATGTTTDISSRLTAIGPNGGTFDTNGNIVSFASGLTGAGSVTKTGAGTLALGAVNTYSGGTLINGGTLALTGSGSIAASSGVNIATGATFDISATTTGATIKTLAGAGGSTVALGAKTLTLSNASSTFAGSLTGTGGLTIAGGVQTLTGASTYTGATTVDGVLYLGSGGAIAGSATTVNTGGLLAGTGTAGSVSVNAGGVFAPGTGAPGTAMTVAGNLAFAPGAFYRVAIDPTAASQAVVTGTATLAGTVQAYFATGSYVTKRYTILTAGGRSGTFDGLATSNLPAGFIASLDYSVPNGVALDLRLGLDGATGLPRNPAAVAGAISHHFNAGGALPPGFVSVVGLTGQPLAGALTQLSGEAATGAPQGAFQMMTAFLGLMTDPFVDGRTTPIPGGIGGSGAALGYAAADAPRPGAAGALERAVQAPSAAPVVPRWSVWGSAYGGSGRLSGDAAVGSHDVSVRAAGVAAGGDWRVTPFTTLGFALGGGGTGWSLTQGLGSGSSDAFQAGVYGTTTVGPAYLAASLAFAEHWITADRRALGTALTARYEAQSFGGRAEAGWRLASPLATVTPYAALQAQAFATPAVRESDPSGAGFGLAYDDRTTTALRTELGTRIEKVVAVRTDATLALRGRIAWAHDRVSDPTVAATFQTLPGAGFTVEGATPARDLALVSAGAELRFANGIALMAKMDGEVAAHSHTVAGTAGLRYAW
ncbi:autotransporter domain-containing protein [Rhodoplanes elegans]|uniref:autotransporter domain-containing protein n=1 Tax=Rhodoplanes elegans TaxID=29408 RepID=UPI0011B9435D|nr:autotransporter domain-containing protein [Rhodoplanes elegans]